MWFGWGFFFVPVCLIFGAIVIYFLVVSSRSSCYSQYTPRHSNANTSRAREIIAERYARGEITREEFLEMKKELER